MSKPLVRKFEIAKLEFASYNSREITDGALEGLRESIEAFGMIDMPVVNAVNGKVRVIGGHQRLKAMLEEGYTHADCVVVQLDDINEKAANLALNSPTIQGKWDYKKALPNMEELAKRIPKLDFAKLDELRKKINLEASRNPLIRTGADKFEQAGNAKSKTNTIYQLGSHRLYCGNALDIPAALFGKARAHACVTDPPYNVDYTPGKDSSKIESDKLDPVAWKMFLESTCETILARTDGPCYVFMSCRELPRFQRVWEGLGGAVHQWLVWAKHQPVVMSFRPTDYCSQHETILYGARSDVELYLPETARTNLLPFLKPARNKAHPTQKPVELIEALVEDAAEEGEIVFEPFAGSGTTIIACENLKRVCYGSEICEHYVDSARKRWAEQVHGEGCAWAKLTPARTRGG